MPDPRRLITGFWALYFLLIAASNLTDAFVATGWLARDMPFTSGNFDLIAKVTAVYAIPDWVNALLFAGVIFWQTALVALFTRALLIGAGLQTAFGVAVGLWASFILADELFIAYHLQGLETTHVGLFVLQCVTWLLCRRVPPSS